MHQKKKISLKEIVFSSSSLTLIGLLVLVLISLPIIKNIQKQLSVNKEISTLDREIEDLEEKNTELKGLISYLNSDQFIEEQARLNLNYKKEGEEVIIIKEKDSFNSVENQNNSQAITSIYNIKGLDNMEQDLKKNNAKKWLSYFWN